MLFLIPPIVTDPDLKAICRSAFQLCNTNGDCATLYNEGNDEEGSLVLRKLAYLGITELFVSSSDRS